MIIPAAIEMLDRDRPLAMDWIAARGTARRANPLFKKHHTFHKSIRDTDDGVAAITSLLEDPEPAVRTLAATHALPSNRERGERELEAVAAGDGLPAHSDEYTLI